MGWDVYCVFVTNGGPDYLGTFPDHETAKADQLLRLFGREAFRRTGDASLLEGMSPEEGALYIGAYPWNRPLRYIAPNGPPAAALTASRRAGPRGRGGSLDASSADPERSQPVEPASAPPTQVPRVPALLHDVPGGNRMAARVGKRGRR
jgi:hypothetical protein